MVYQAVIAELERDGKTEQARDPNTRISILWHAHKLWDGTHPRHPGTRRSKTRVIAMVYRLISEREGEGKNAEEVATVQ